MLKFNEIVSVLPNEKVRICSNKDLLTEISSKEGTYKITGRDSIEFPETEKPQKKEIFEIKGKEFLKIINKTEYATSKDDLKPALGGVCFNIEEEKITAVSTDGHRLVKYIKETKTKTRKNQTIIIPKKFLKIIKSTILTQENLKIELDENLLLTKQKELTIITRIIKEKFPDFNSVIPENNTKKATIIKEKLILSLKRVSIFSNRTTKQIIINFDKKGSLVSAQDPETATSGKEYFEAKYEGDPLTISYNAKYLIEVLQHIDNKEIIFYLNSPLSATIINPKTEESTEKNTNLLMPLRLNN